MTINLAHTDKAPATQKQPARILVLGPAARGIAGALLRLESTAEIFAAETAANAIEYIKAGDFDHVLVDNRADGALSLSVPALANVKSIGKLIVLAGPQSSESIAAMPGVDHVISAPYNPIEIAGALNIEITDNRAQERAEANPGRRVDDAPEIRIHGEVDGTSADEKSEDMRPVFMEGLSALVRFIPGLTPILSLLYKNVALTMLAALFVAFISYGIMIVYFLTSGDWSSPLQLQRGHELVIKAERERGELQVKRNLVIQQLADADAKAKRGQNAIDRANVLAQIVGSTIDQEIANQKDRRVLINNDLKALKGVLKDYGSAKSREAERARLRSAYKRRVITRAYYQNAMLNLSEIGENVVNLNERISKKKSELRHGSQAIAYLTQLNTELKGSTQGQGIANGKAEFIPIANQVIEVQQVRAAGEADLADFEQTKNTLENSAAVLTGSIQEIEKTPMIRALEKPVNVLFVPYGNISAYQKDEPLYSCTFTIVWCSKVGSVGNPIGGEISTTHPFFGKPIRGQFVEANLTEISAAQEEIIHVGRPPLFF